jgi:mannosyltransferase
LLVMGSLLIVGRRNRRAPVLGVGSVAIPWLVLPTACLLAGSLYHPIFVSRYVLFSLPALALLAGAAVVDVGRAVGLSRSTPALRTSVAAVCIGVLALVVAKPQAELRRLDAHGDDPAAEAAYLISVTKPGDGIVYAPRDLVHSLVPYATQGQLPADALLARSATASSTLNGVQVGAAQVPAALLRYDRLWVLDIPGLEDDDPLAITTGAILATHFHEVSVTAEHGVQIVLYLRIGS